MKTLRIFEKRLTWILVGITLPMAPLLALAFPRLPVAEGFRTIRENAISQWAPPSGSDAGPRLKSLRKDLSSFLNLPAASTTFASVDSSMRFWGTPEMQPLARCLEPKFLPLLKRYAQVGHKGSVDFTTTRFYVEDFETGLVLSRIGGLLAFAQAGRGEYDQAIETARNAGDLFDAISADPAGARLAAGAKLMSSRLYEELLTGESGTTVAQAILNRLQARDDYRPFSPLPFFASPGEDVLSWKEQLVFDSIMSRHLLMQAAWRLAQDYPHLTRPENQAWAARILVASHHQVGPPDISRSPLFPMYPVSPPWTFFSALESEFRHVVETEDNLLWQRLGGREVFGEVDPVIAALYAYSIVESNLTRVGVTDSWRKLATRKDLLRLAAAARLDSAGRGQWPESISELQKQVSLTGDPTTTAAPTLREEVTVPFRHPYTPYHLGQVEITRNNVERLLGIASPSAMLDHSAELVQTLELKQSDSVTPGWDRYRIRISSPQWSKNPMLAFALADTVRTRMGSAETTVVRSNRFHRSEEIEVTRGQALATALNANPGIRNLCPEARQNDPPVTALESIDIPIDLLIDVEVPKHVFAVWSEGEKVGDPADDLIVFLPEAK